MPVTYSVHNLKALLDLGGLGDKTEHAEVALQTALNDLAADGNVLVAIQPQYRSWDDEGQFEGFQEALYIFQS